MKKLEEDLFNGLNKMCAENEAFYFSEQDYNTHIIRSYTYRLASWTEFQKPYALDCRGTAFIFDKETEEWSLFTRAYRKFFNLNEGVPKEDYIKDNNPLHSFEKLDGCVSATTLLRVKDTNDNECLIPIKDIIESGEYTEVYSYNIKNKRYEYTPIINTLITTSDKKWVELTINNNTVIKCTEDHQFLTTKGWVEAKLLLSQELL